MHTLRRLVDAFVGTGSMENTEESSEVVDAASAASPAPNSDSQQPKPPPKRRTRTPRQKKTQTVTAVVPSTPTIEPVASSSTTATSITTTPANDDNVPAPKRRKTAVKPHAKTPKPRAVRKPRPRDTVGPTSANISTDEVVCLGTPQAIEASTLEASGNTVTEYSSLSWNPMYHEVTTPKDLHDWDFQMSFQWCEVVQLLNVLLVDCRSPAEIHTQTRKLELFPCIRIKPTSFPSGATSKISIVRMILDKDPSLLDSLQAPGYYSHIVVFDTDSTSMTVSPDILKVLNLFCHWNQNTSTKTSLLNGGYNGIVKEKPTLFRAKALHGLPWVLNHHNNKFHRLHPRNLKTLSHSGEDLALKGLQDHLCNLHQSIKHHSDMTALKKKIRSMGAIRATLRKEVESTVDVVEYVESVVPEDMKCPICMEMMNKEIMQCHNGHTMCSPCSEKVIACPVCRISFYKVNTPKTRNRAMERIIATVGSIPCPFSKSGCTEVLPFGKLEDHVKNCERIKTPETEQLRKEIESMREKLEAMNEEVVNLNKKLEETELKWNTICEGDFSVASRRLMDEILEANMNLLKAKIALPMGAF